MLQQECYSNERGDKITNFNETKTIISKISDLLESQLINYLAEHKRLYFEIAPDGFEFIRTNEKIEYIISLHLEDYNLIKNEIDYLLYYVVDNMPVLKSAYIKNEDDFKYIVFEQKT